MKNILEIKASRKLGADHVIKAVLLDVGSPPPSEPDKQPIVLCLPPGDVKLNCNIIGKHLHIDPVEKGRLIWITSKKDGAMYLSCFDDGKQFLTIRDGITYNFRPLPEGTKMNSPKDRLFPLAQHFRLCWDAADVAMSEVVGADITEIAKLLWLETKAGVIVPVTPSEPIQDARQSKEGPVPKADPPPGKPPEEDPTVREKQIEMCVAEYRKWDYPKLCENAAAAFKSTSTKMVSLIKKEAVIRLLDETKAKEPKVWMDVYDDIWQSVSDEFQQALDSGVAGIIESDKGKSMTDSDVHRAACLLYVSLTKINEPI
jgi:hypothetical protein